MLLATEDHDQVLQELLFIRAVWSLNAGASIPNDLKVDPGLRQSPPFPADDLAIRWEADWADRVEFLADPAGPRPGDAMDRSRVRRWRESQPPPWGLLFGDWWPAEAHREWERLSVSKLTEPSRHDVMRLPAVLDELIAAWRVGFRQNIILPLDSYFAGVVSSDTVMISERTFQDPARYAATLREFRGSQ